MQSTIVIHWDEQTLPEVAHRIADEAAGAVMNIVHTGGARGEETYDSDVTATLWEHDDVA